MRRKFFVAASIAGAATLFALTGSASGNTVTTANGTWDAYPGQSASYQTAVQQPINSDGSSNFKAKGSGVIPVKFALSEGTGPFVFQSIWSDTATSNNYSYLIFTPKNAITFADISSLIANYAFTTGDCYGGSLRWTINLTHNSVAQNVYDYYGDPGGVQSCSGDASGSGQNLITSGATNRFEMANGWPTSSGPVSSATGTYRTYDDASNVVGGDTVNWIQLVVDSGWFNAPNGDQVVNLTNASIGVGGTSGYTDTFTPQAASGMTPTCDLPANATIKITKLDGAATGDVNDPLSIQPNDTNGIFRVVDCKLMYNLAISSLQGVGTYTVYAVINGTTATSPATFDLK